MPDELLTPNQVVQKLLALGRDMAAAVELLKITDRDAVKARHDADVRESKAFINAEGSMDLRKHVARSHPEVIDLEEKALLLEAQVRYIRAKIKHLESQIEIGRSYGVVVREEMKLAGYEPG